MAMRFKPSPDTSIGVEIELGLINSETLELSMDVPEMLQRLPAGWEDSIKPEFMRSYLEFNTGVCKTVDEVKERPVRETPVGL